MIWSAGSILPDHALTVPTTDRTFEHGLGLFETLRTWNGRPTLLEAHRNRMIRSAQTLGLPLDPATLPDAAAVKQLLDAERAEVDRRLRITATGGSGTGRSLVWMKSDPLPPAFSEAGINVLVGPWRVLRDDLLARHKTLNYWSRRQAHETAVKLGCDEALSRADGMVWEGCRTNLFAVLGGILVTPTTLGPIVPGVMRALVLDVCRRHDLEVQEVEGIDPDRLRSADELFLTNSVRGIVPIRRVRWLDPSDEQTWPPNQPLTRAVTAAVSLSLE